MAKDYGKGMKVREVMAELAKMDPELVVVAEGCDCDNPVKRVTVERYNWTGLEQVAYMGTQDE